MMREIFFQLRWIWVLSLTASLIIDIWFFPGRTVFPDEQRFLSAAVRLAEDGQYWVLASRAWEMPGTALFYTPWVWLFGKTGAIIPVRFVQALLLIAQSALAAVIAWRIFGAGKEALIAATIVAIYPFFLFYQGLLLSEPLFDFLLLAAFAALYWWRDRGLRADYTLVLACACFAIATLTKATLTMLPPFLFAVLVWASGARIGRVGKVLLIATCFYSACLAPWWARNAAVLGTFVPFTTSSAHNLYLGNNPNSRDGGIDWSTNVDQAFVAAVSAMPDELDRQRAYSRAAIDYIKTNPVDFIGAAAIKFTRFWNPLPNATEFRGGIYAVIGALSYGPILLLALWCAVSQRAYWASLSPILLLVLYFTVLHAVVIASLRYRLPLESLLIVLAARPLALLIDYGQKRLAGG
jgi:4-amino-4-deoxy-L-arabinose transferase-like glycosyltransferase